MKGSIKITEQYINNVIMPNIMNIAKNGGNEYIFCVSELDSRLAENFKFDIDICDSYMSKKDFFTTTIENKDAPGCIYYCIQWNNNVLY